MDPFLHQMDLCVLYISQTVWNPRSGLYSHRPEQWLMSRAMSGVLFLFCVFVVVVWFGFFFFLGGVLSDNF